jgi:hypothetical protein
MSASVEPLFVWVVIACFMALCTGQLSAITWTKLNITNEPSDGTMIAMVICGAITLFAIYMVLQVGCSLG